MVQMAQEGKNREEIESILMERFGEETLGSPLRGDLVVGVSLAALIAVALIWRKARSWVRGPKSDASTRVEPASSELSAADRDRLEEELDRLEA